MYFNLPLKQSALNHNVHVASGTIQDKETTMDKLILEIERTLLECNVCTEVFDEEDRVPRVLPCYHTFCTGCVNKIRSKKSIRCPTCNAVHKDSERLSLDNLPKDNTRRDLTTLMEKIDCFSAKLIQCHDCSRYFDRYFSCADCKENFCILCAKTHKQQISQTIELERYDVGPTYSCPCHQYTQLRYVCTSPQCQCVVCPICAVEDHRNEEHHHLQNIDDAFESSKSTLTLNLAQLQSRIESVLITKKKLIEYDTFLSNKKTEILCVADDKYRSSPAHANDNKVVKDIMARIESLVAELVRKIGETDEFLCQSMDFKESIEKVMNETSLLTFVQVFFRLESHFKTIIAFPHIDHEYQSKLDDINKMCFEYLEHSYQRKDLHVSGVDPVYKKDERVDEKRGPRHLPGGLKNYSKEN